MITEIPTVQNDLGGFPINRDVAFVKLVKLLQKESKDYCFSESELIEKMLELVQFWQTEEAATAYWRRRNPNYNKNSEYFEPHIGRFQLV